MSPERGRGRSTGGGKRGEDEEGRRLPINWPALLSLFAGTVAVAYALPFFPGALLLSVIGAYLGDRGRRFANETPGRPGRALSWWALIICGVAFAFSLAVALQAQTILGDPELLRDALDRVEETGATEAGLAPDGQVPS